VLRAWFHQTAVQIIHFLKGLRIGFAF